MDLRNIMQSQGKYMMDFHSQKSALNMLNSINQSQKPDHESIFQQSQSQHYGGTVSLFNILLDGKSHSQECLDQILTFPKIMNQNQRLSQQMPELQQSYSEHFQLKIDHQSERGSNFSTTFLGNNVKQPVKPKKKYRTKATDGQKNIFPNTAKRIVKMVFKKCLNLTKDYFQKRNISFAQFETNYKGLLQQNGSGLGLHSYLSEKPGELKEMSIHFIRLFEKFLRKKYLILSLREGKMQDLKSYIGCKNRQLLYFSTYLKNYQQIRQ